MFVFVLKRLLDFLKGRMRNVISEVRDNSSLYFVSMHIDNEVSANERAKHQV